MVLTLPMEGGDLFLCCVVSLQTLLPEGGAGHAGDHTLQVCHDLTSSESEVTNVKNDIGIVYIQEMAEGRVHHSI